MSEEFPNEINFTVDSKLLQELGERLVGKHFMALAELIKNSYDADANLVNLIFSDEDGGKIIIDDDGNGMTFEEFKKFWMRIGSRHKEGWKHSPHYTRSLTGSKGVGRLSAQLLADEIQIITTSKNEPDKKIYAHAKWSEAVEAGELQKAKASYRIENGKFSHGTKIILAKLKKKWIESDFKELAKELWELVPPFEGMMEKERFDIIFKSNIVGFEQKFKEQMKAILKDYEWKITGENKNGKVITSYQYRDYPPNKYEFALHDGDALGLKGGKFEIRIYRLWGKQRFELYLKDVQEYLFRHGGVHIYDSGFHLPYYGDPENDWLGILSEHARRMMQFSPLIPEEVQIESGLQFLPGAQRILGVVRINTAEEPALNISITRDRLLEGKSYRELRKMIRTAMHYYAMLEAKRKYSMDEMRIEAERYPPEEFQKVDDLLDNYKDKIPDEVYRDIKKEIDKTTGIIDEQEEKLRESISLIGALATAGISSIAYQHEITKQLASIGGTIKDIEKIIQKNTDTSIKTELESIKDDLIDWNKKAKRVNSLFEYFMDPENYQERQRFNAKDVIDDIISQTKNLAGEIKSLNNVSKDLLLPKASLLEWSSIFQNVIINAFNALDKSKEKTIEIVDRSKDNEHEILIMDTGCGVNLDEAKKLFLPFERKIKLPVEKKALGYGGMGLGLTIVKFIADRIRIKVEFVEPPNGFSTAFSIKWRKN